MRVSEFAKRTGLPAGIILAQAKVLRLDVSSTLSTLDEDDLVALNAWVETLSQADRNTLLTKYETSRKSRKSQSEALRTSEIKRNREAVDLHRQHALEVDAAKHSHKHVTPSQPVVIQTEVSSSTTPEVAVVPPNSNSKQTSTTSNVDIASLATPPPPGEMKPTKTSTVTQSAESPIIKPAAETSKQPITSDSKANKFVSQVKRDTNERTQPIGAPIQKKNSPPSTLNATLAPSTVVQKPTLTKSVPARPTLVGLSPTPPMRGKTDGRGNDDSRNGNRGGRERRTDDRRGTGGRNERSDKTQRRPAAPQKGTPAPASTPQVAIVTGKKLQLNGPVTVKELAELMDVLPNKLIVDLMGLKVLATINQTLEIGIVQKIAEKYGFSTEMEERSKRSAERKPQLKSEDADDEIPEDKPEDMCLRPPVVTFLGHVDHGKTTLMDYIRKSHVAAGEAGGITQHIAAYTIEVDQTDDNGNKRLITFVDTPGHSAFESMRARGANITDIAVIIVAADDGVMPQTREAIKHARNAGVQMLVAVTKCDKPDANPMRVYQMLQAEGLTPSTWGGDIECCEVSGTTGQGVDDLLETILIQADVLELQANPNRRANGAVIESQLEQGLGPTATLLVQGGTLKVGDVVLCGEHYGKVRTLIDERGKQVKSAGPSIAVKCTGLSGVPEAGSEFRVMLNEKRARELAERTAEANKLQSLSAAQSSSMADWTKLLGADGKAQLDVIIKADTQGTAEAVVECLKEIKSEKVSLKVLYSGVGSITAADVQRAKDATILGFSVNCEPGVQAMARQNGIRVNTFRIIYELIEHVKRCMLDLIAPEYKEVVRGHAEIRQVFDISKLGKIAGCQMLDGTLKFKGKFRIYRGKNQIFDGAVVTMKHFKEDVKEISPAQECGLGFGSFEAFQEGDIVECYEMEELPKTL